MTNFLCECGNLDCIEEISLTDAEYAKLRSNAATFAVVPGHALEDVETVIEETDRFYIVEKHRRPTRSGSSSDGFHSLARSTPLSARSYNSSTLCISFSFLL
jgi:hypothetical protein